MYKKNYGDTISNQQNQSSRWNQQQLDQQRYGQQDQQTQRYDQNQQRYGQSGLSIQDTIQDYHNKMMNTFNEMERKLFSEFGIPDMGTQFGRLGQQFGDLDLGNLGKMQALDVQ